MSAQVTQLRISRTGWVVIALLLLAPWSATFWLLRQQNAPATEAPPKLRAPLQPAQAAGAAQARLLAGPWGELQAMRIVIEPPTDFIPARFGDEQARWVFRDSSAAALSQLWDRAGLTEAQRKVVTDPKRCETEGTTIIVRPDRATVVSLSREARAAIYSRLAEFTDNPPQKEPFRFPAELADEWLQGVDLPDNAVKLTRQLMYPRNSIMCFSDYDAVLPLLGSGTERIRYLKTLSRKSALLVKLKVNANTDVERVADYWGRGRRSKDVRPLIQSVAQHPGGGSIDVVHLLPRFARSLLYTYPLPSDNPRDGSHDCHWTTFNFYKDQPDERFDDINFVKQTLLNDYYPVGGEPALGDVIILLQPNGVVVHSCVQIADDMVFTKNGPLYSVPWLLVRLPDVVAFYSIGSQPLEIRRYRPKGL